MHIVDRYKYQELIRETSPDGPRVYLTPAGNRVPSVTTVLSGTKDMTFLKEWKKRVGNAEADTIVKRSIDYGNAVHKNLEDYILEGKEPTGNIFARHMTKQIITKGLSKVDEVWGVEVPLYAEELYAGTTDLCGVHSGDPAIMDFKNSRSFRKDEWISDYKLQVAAYGLAHNEMYNTKIRKGVIMLAAQTGEYQEWIVEGNDFDKAADEWAKRLEQYLSKHG